MIEVLDANLAIFDSILQRDLGKSVGNIPGAGAAGGLGAGLLAFLNAELKAGIEIVVEATQLAERLADADLVITGEGQINFQTVFGKTPVGVAKAAKTYNIPVIAIAGSIAVTDAEGAFDARSSDGVYNAGIDAMIDIVPDPMLLEVAIENATTLTATAAERAARMVAVGMKMNQPPD
jgi:glycerate kinase